MLATGIPSRTRTSLHRGPEDRGEHARDLAQKYQALHAPAPAGVGLQQVFDERGRPSRKTMWKPWDRKRCEQWANRIGPDCATVIGKLFAMERLDEQAVDPALAVLRLSKRYSAQRLENACSLALQSVASPRYAHIGPILESGQDIAGEIPDDAGDHGADGGDDGAGWVRGGDYYANMGR